MNSEQEQKLVDYLASLGFKDEKLLTAVREKASRETPGFMTETMIPFGEERMDFRLSFKRDPQFDAYRLEKFHATHRSAVAIDHKTINGIDTEALEEKMKALDWESYFNNFGSIVNTDAMKEMRETVAMVVKLAENQNFDGIKIQGELMYKFWPANAYTGMDGMDDLKAAHEREWDFEANEFGICNANLAYHIVSGRLDDLREKLSTIELETWPGVAVHRRLEDILSENPTDFNLKFAWNDKSGYSEFNIPVFAEPDYFHIDKYELKFTHHPVIEDGIYNGIDTAKLEGLMKAIDWQDASQLFIPRDDKEPDFTPKVEEILIQINQMQKDDTGQAAADKLMVKYWSDCVFFDSKIRDEAWQYLDSLPKFSNNFPIELNVKSAYNLLNGRAIPAQKVYPYRPPSEEWLRLNLSERGGNGNYLVEHVGKLNEKELENILDVFPITNMSYYQVKNSLLRGDLCPVNLKNDKTVLMEVNPEQRTVNVYTPDMRLIPTNVHLDPDWKPPLSQQPETVKQSGREPKVKHNKYITTRPIRKNRGKGL